VGRDRIQNRIEATVTVPWKTSGVHPPPSKVNCVGQTAPSAPRPLSGACCRGAPPLGGCFGRLPEGVCEGSVLALPSYEPVLASSPDQLLP